MITFLKNLFTRKKKKKQLQLLEEYNNGIYLRVDGKTNNKELIDNLRKV